VKILDYPFSKSVLSRLKCSKFVFSRGSAPNPLYRTLQRSPDPCLVGRGSLSRPKEPYLTEVGVFDHLRKSCVCPCISKMCLAPAVLDIALLYDEHMLRSALQSWNWAADWHELMIPQRIMRPSIARASEQLDPRCSMQTYHRPQLH